jgi:hypothetical protein
MLPCITIIPQANPSPASRLIRHCPVSLMRVMRAVGCTHQLGSVERCFTAAVTDELDCQILLAACHKTLFKSQELSTCRVVFCPRCCWVRQLSVDVPFFSMDLGLSGCVQAEVASFPRYKAMWTCGQRVKGAAPCAPGASDSKG